MPTEQGFLELCRHDLATFALRAFCELYATDPTWNWHLDVVIDALNGLQRGDNLRQLILLPPRSLKSFICSVVWPAFLLGSDPGMKILCVSYSQSLADDLARLCHDLMTSEWYNNIFPTRLAGGRPAIDNLRTTSHGYRMATSVGGTLTGRGADLIIIDDPIKADDAYSEPIRQSAMNWFRNTLPSRIDNKKTGKIMVVMQRLHQDDPAGHLIDAGWPALILPAIASDDVTHIYSTVFGPEKKEWKEGEPLQPEREPVGQLEQLRAEMGSFSFSAQYLQAPVPLEGNLVKRAWFRTFEPQAVPSFDQTIQSWDTASKTAETSDFSVCTTWGVKGSQYYLLDVYRRKLAFPELVRAVENQAIVHRSTLVLIEDKNSGIALIQQLQVNGFGRARPYVPRLDKVARFIGVTSIIEQGQVFLPTNASWVDEYLTEVCGFPQTRHDDQVDSTSQALDWLRDQGNPGGLYFYYQQEGEKRRARETDRTVHLRPQFHTSHVILTNGESIVANADGTFWVPEVDARALRRAGFTQLD